MKEKINIKDDPDEFQEILNDLRKKKVISSASTGSRWDWDMIIGYKQVELMQLK